MIQPATDAATRPGASPTAPGEAAPPVLVLEQDGVHFALDTAVVHAIERAGSAAAAATYDLLGLLGAAGETGASRRVVVLETGRGRWGLRVDRIVETVADLRPHPMPRGAACGELPYGGVVVRGESLALVLDAERLHPADPAREGSGPRALRPLARPPAAPAPAPGEGPARLFLFRLAAGSGEHCGLSLRQVVEVADRAAWSPLPGAPAHVLGLTAWRGRPLAVVDLARRLGLGRTVAASRTKLLVARLRGGELLALTLGGEQRILPLPLPARPTELPPLPDPSLVCAAFEHEGGTLLVPDLEAVAHTPAA